MAHTRTTRTALRWALVVAAAVAGTLAAVTPAEAAPGGVQYVKYYQVTSSYQGAPENLSEKWAAAPLRSHFSAM